MYIKSLRYRLRSAVVLIPFQLLFDLIVASLLVMKMLFIANFFGRFFLVSIALPGRLWQQKTRQLKQGLRKRFRKLIRCQ